MLVFASSGDFDDGLSNLCKSHLILLR